MDFHELLNVADSNKTEAESEASVKRYSTTFSALKKPARSGVPSEAVMRFLAKKRFEEQQKALEAQKKKEELLALRSQNTKNSKKAKIMASRTKDNDFSRIKLTEDEMEAKKKREAEILRMQLHDKVERMKARIEMEEKEMLLPRKRKRKSKHDDAEEDNPNHDEDYRHMNNAEEEARPKKMSRKLRKEMELDALIAEMAAEKKKKPYQRDMNQKNKPPPHPSNSSSLSYDDLLRLASQKQHEPIKLPEVEVDNSDNRPLTKKQRALFEEEKARAQRKLAAQNANSSPSISPKTYTAQSSVLKASKNISNDRTIDQNNNTVKKNFPKKVTENKLLSKNKNLQYDDQVNLQASQPLQKEFNIPKKYPSQKHPSQISKTEAPVPPGNSSSFPKAKKFNSISQNLSDVKSNNSRNVQNQMPNPGGSSRPYLQNSKIKDNSNLASSYPEAQSPSHKTAASKQRVNSAREKHKGQQFGSSQFTNETQKKIMHSGETFSKTEKGSHMQYNKNPKPNFKQQMKNVNEKVNEDQSQVFDDIFMSGETLLRTGNGTYIQSSEKFKHKGNTPSSFGSKNMKNAIEQNRGTNSVQMSSLKMSRNNQSVHNQYTSDKPRQPVTNKTQVYRETEYRPNHKSQVTSGKELPKMYANPGFKNKDSVLPSKNVLPKSPYSAVPESIAKKAASSNNAKALKDRTLDRTVPAGKLAPVNRPLSAKPEMRKHPGLPPARPPNSSATKQGMSSKPFHINPYLDAPRRLLEPQRPPKPPMKRRIESDDDDEDDDDDDDMSDFIDDGPCYDDTNYSEHIKEIFRYDRSKYADFDDDDIMESSFAEQMKEEMRSAKLGYLEDLEDMKQEEEERKRKMKKKRLKP